MLNLKTLTVLAAGCLLMTALRPAAAQLSDAYALAETRADIPANWVPWPETNDNTRDESADLIRHHWMGRRENPNKSVSPKNHILVAADITVSLCPSSAGARAGLEQVLHHNQAPPARGSYSGAPLGDLCYRAVVDTDNGAVLWFCRANAYFYVDVRGPAGDLNYPAVAEKIARAMLGRADAALALAQSGGGSAAMSVGNVGVRRPRGVPVVLVDEWASGAGARLQPDWRAGTAVVTRGGHTLGLMVGRRDARLDGKPITLAFPALRSGKSRLWCPVATLNMLAR